MQNGICQLRCVIAVCSLLLVPAAAIAQAGPQFARTSSYVSVRDGTRLAMNVYRPVRNGTVVDTKLPVIFLFTPYRARYRSPDGKLVELDQVHRLGVDRLLEAGYVIAEADIRGKGASFGARRGFQDRTEANDGYDLVQWLASQPFSNGVVGMMGCSYLGGSTVQVASTQPPALKAAFIGATDLDKFDFVRAGGITAQFNTRPDEPLSDDLASMPMDDDRDGSLLRAAVTQHAGNTPMAALWYGMPFRDSISPLTGNRFWEEVGPYSYLPALKASGIATYYWGNLKDEPTSQVILAAANLGSKLLIGPGSHCVAPPEFDLGGEILRFFDHHLKGSDNGIEKEPRNTWWVENAAADRHWQHSELLPGAAATPHTWYLANATTPDPGLIDKRPTVQNTRNFTVDYQVGEGEYFAFWVEPQDAHGLTFTSAPLAHELLLEGYPLAHLRLAADRDDINAFVYLEEIDGADKVEVLSHGRLAASYRATATPPFDMLGLPWHPGREADRLPLVPGKVAGLDIALLPVSHLVPAGHRLRVTVTGADPRQRNLAQIRLDPPPHITLGLGGEAGSQIVLPVRQPQFKP